MHRYISFAAIPAAFAAGLAATHLAPSALAQNTMQQEIKPQIIDLAAMTDAQIGPLIPNVGTIRSKTLVATPDGTIAIQSGDAPKHTHTHSLEAQYVIAGHGTFWLGGQSYQIHPGDLIVIPPGTVHAGSVADDGRFKVIAIKLPPQQAGDMHMVP